MPEPTSIAAAGTALATAIATVTAALKGLSDIKAMRERVALFEEALATIRRRVEEVADSIDPHLRADLDVLAAAVKRYRAETRGAQPTGSHPSLDQSVAEAALRDADQARRLIDIERRVGQLETFVDAVRLGIVDMKADIRHMLNSRRDRDGRGSQT